MVWPLPATSVAMVREHLQSLQRRRRSDQDEGDGGGLGTGSSGVRRSLLPKGEGLGGANLEWEARVGGGGSWCGSSGVWKLGTHYYISGGLGEGSQRRRGGVLERSTELIAY